MPERIVSIRPMTLEDLDPVVAIHERSFPGFFLTTLGSSFLRLFYRALLQFDGSLAWVACVHQEVVGCVVGVPDHRVFHSFLRRRFAITGAVRVVRTLLRTPSVALRLLRAYRSSGPQLPHAEGPLLMSIAVDPERSGNGVGKQLLSAFAADLAGRGYPAFRLTTDRYANTRVNGFYESAGMTLERTYATPEGRWLNQYVYHLHPEAKP